MRALQALRVGSVVCRHERGAVHAFVEWLTRDMRYHGGREKEGEEDGEEAREQTAGSSLHAPLVIQGTERRGYGLFLEDADAVSSSEGVAEVRALRADDVIMCIGEEKWLPLSGGYALQMAQRYQPQIVAGLLPSTSTQEEEDTSSGKHEMEAGADAEAGAGEDGEPTTSKRLEQRRRRAKARQRERLAAADRAQPYDGLGVAGIDDADEALHSGTSEDGARRPRKGEGRSLAATARQRNRAIRVAEAVSLATQILLESIGKEHPHFSFWDFLRATTLVRPHALTVTQQELDRLQGSWMFPHVSRRRAFYTEIAANTFQKADRGLFLWAMSQVLSRAVSSPEWPFTMLPGIDLLNHSARAPNCAVHFDTESACFSLRATCTIEPGDELLLSYGSGRDAASTLALYGFFDPTALNQGVHLDLSYLKRRGGDELVKWRRRTATARRLFPDCLKKVIIDASAVSAFVDAAKRAAPQSQGSGIDWRSLAATGMEMLPADVRGRLRTVLVLPDDLRVDHGLLEDQSLEHFADTLDVCAAEAFSLTTDRRVVQEVQLAAMEAFDQLQPYAEKAREQLHAQATISVDWDKQPERVKSLLWSETCALALLHESQQLDEFSQALQLLAEVLQRVRDR